MELEEKIKTVLETYEFDITNLIDIPCKRAYICMGEKYKTDQIRIYGNTYIKAEEFENYLRKEIPEIESSLKKGYLSLDTQDVTIEFENGRFLDINSSEWLSVSFGKG